MDQSKPGFRFRQQQPPPARPARFVSPVPSDASVNAAPRRVLRRTGIILGILSLILAGTAAGLYAWAMVSAPDLDSVSVSPRGWRTAVLDDAGTEILTLAGAESNRVYVTLDEIPEDLQNAFIAIEDSRFYQHRGVDLRGILRAMAGNLRSGSLSQGASTLTQQLIKNNVFDAGMKEKTALDKIRRKLQEQILALRLERRASKAWILETYLNTINLGGGTWGVQAAAQRYFGVDVSGLTLPECAALAAVTKSPAAYNPLRNPEKNRQRARLVLSRMRELGMITEEQQADAASEDIYAPMEERGIGAAVRAFTWFEDAAVSQAAEDLQSRLGYSEADAWRLLYQGGLTVETTQNTALQRLCEAAVNGADTEAQMTVVVIDPSSGEVKALVGGRGEKDASLTWNRALSSPRQPGSTLKIVGEYAAALDSGIATLATVYDDAPTSYSDGTPIRNAGGSYRGRTSVREAIAHSLNTVALRCFWDVGPDAVWRQLQRFGFAHLDQRDRVEALALGGTHGGVTNLELTAAYAAIAGGGTYREPHFYTRILDRQGNLLLTADAPPRRVMRPETAALLTSAMEDVLTEGTGREAAVEGRTLAGKSGTTSDRRDLWFVGFSPALACGVWGGFDDNAPQAVSAPVKAVWRAVMEGAEPSDAAFPRPAGLEQRTVCAKCGQLAVEGLCDSTVQGDMARTEWFAPGTAPVLRCTCHVRLDLCAETGQRAGLYCRDRISRVFLREGTEGTADADAVCPNLEPCTLHRRWWNWLFPAGPDAATPDGGETTPDAVPPDRNETKPDGEPPDRSETTPGAVPPDRNETRPDREPPVPPESERAALRDTADDYGWWTLSDIRRVVEWYREGN
ncbi:MAG: PBP1A family penicillin-binding protein [Oscillibacter sp.]|nr:PBP1A family penicillin-binding protein [Oscillibacter sp.]